MLVLVCVKRSDSFIFVSVVYVKRSDSLISILLHGINTVQNGFVNGIFWFRFFPFTDCKRKKTVLLTSTYP